MVNVLIYGAGAIGSFVGYLLSEFEGNKGKAIENVALLGRTNHIQKIKKSGLIINFSHSHKSYVFNHCFSNLEDLDNSIFSPDIVIVCVKTYSLRGLLQDLMASGMLSGKLEDVSFVLLMNGMGNREIFGLTSNDVYEGITSMGVKFSEDGLIELKGLGKTVLDDAIDPEVKQFIKKRFEEKGFEIEFAADIKIPQWNKLFVNSVINPITALAGKQNGIVLSKCLEDTIERIVGECVSVAVKEGYKADKNSTLNLVYSVASKTSINTSSMLQDLRKGKMTEIDSINGYVIGLAKKHSISVPVNETLYSLVKSIGTSCG